MDRIATVITASLPHRAKLLKEAMISVQQQSVPVNHLVMIDENKSVAQVRNILLEVAQTPYVIFLDDDDTLNIDFMKILLHHAWNTDVVIPYCWFDGPPLPDGYYNRPYDRNDLRAHGIFPITVLAKRESILACGGFPEDEQWEDWILWNRMADAGCSFKTVEIPLWTYRTNSDNRRTNQILGLT